MIVASMIVASMIVASMIVASQYKSTVASLCIYIYCKAINLAGIFVRFLCMTSQWCTLIMTSQLHLVFYLYHSAAPVYLCIIYNDIAKS